MTTHEILVAAKAAAPLAATLSTDTKNHALHAMADALLSHSTAI